MAGLQNAFIFGPLGASYLPMLVGQTLEESELPAEPSGRSLPWPQGRRRSQSIMAHFRVRSFAALLGYWQALDPFQRLHDFRAPRPGRNSLVHVTPKSTYGM